jgi:hypothetical protein
MPRAWFFVSGQPSERIEAGIAGSVGDSITDVQTAVGNELVRPISRKAKKPEEKLVLLKTLPLECDI